MLIKQQALASHLTKHLSGLYVLIGQDHFLINNAAESIKLAWRQKDIESEDVVLYINNSSDWSLLNEKAYSYSLFANILLIDIRYEKKTLDAAGKTFFSTYLQKINPDCLLLLRAPNLPLKQVQGLVNHSSVHVIQATPLNGLAMQSWIVDNLQQNGLQFEPQIPALIYQYTQGNMLASAQVIEKLKLITDEKSILTTVIVKEQLVDQCDYQLFELSDACLSGDSNKAIQLLRHACNSNVEPTFILWLLAQEIRQLIQLIELTKQSLPFATACNQLKIWSQRVRLYQLAMQHVQLDNLLQLLQFCKKIDECIKSSQSNQVWQALEQIALSLCLGKQVGNFA